MSDKDDFFIGWSAETPKADRRFFMLAGLGLLAGTGGAAALIGGAQDGGGPGTWDQGDIQEWRGIASALPYPTLRTRDTDGKIKTAFLSCLNKCTPELRINQYRDGEVVIRGSAIRRGEHLMIATEDSGAWISQASGSLPDQLALPEEEALGSAELRGEILDTKCWFGAMRPSSGKVHKACASLCIRSGLPPAFYVKPLREQERLLIITDRRGAPVSQDVLPYVADRMRLSGDVVRKGDVLYLRTDVSTFERV
ncbi:hypothetical protein HK107_11885 [Parvularcula sp. ZS-1/3]|uniref:Uncharacterized protein n=1 Tax=Parvularcula mediterranea TaxID=2732508 RepID=A0A7Y3RNX5_9PROT|nr:hypothetical protein [Parvularcula mediterranea]NNU17021.1 hypothetical protein [Parvularcula mediterranea]